MKNLLLAALILITACSKKQTEFIEQAALPVARLSQSLATPGPDLRVVSFSTEYDGYANGIGLRSGNLRISRILVSQTEAKVFGFPLGELIRVVSYDCPIENISAQGKENDFVLDLSDNGTANGSGYYIDGLLSLALFQNSLPVMPELKQSFQLQTTSVKVGYDWKLHTNYQWDTSFIHAQALDKYRNMVRVPEGNGTYILAVQVNPNKKFFETDYTNNVSTLPFRIENDAIYLEPTLTGKALPVTDLTATYSLRGKDKNVFLDWECPYHEPIYVTHSFTIYKNGVLLADHIHESNFTDYVKGSTRNISTYEVFINVVGLERSEGTKK